MATSGIQNFSQTTIKLVEDALDKIGILSEGRSISANELNKVVRQLNSMIQTWEAEWNINVWKNREATLFLEKGKQSYQLGNNQANATESFVDTTLSAAALSGASTITVTDATGITNGFFIGIVLADGTAQFTTVNGAPAGNVVTLTDVLTGAASSGALVVSFQTKITKPLRLTQMQQSTLGAEAIDIYAIEYNRDEYFRLASKTTEGSALQFYYNVNISDTTLFVWPTAATSFDILKFTYQPQFDIFVGNNDDVDFPAEWYETLVYNLAKRLGPSYGFTVHKPSPYKDVSDEADRLYRKLRNSTRPMRTVEVVNEYDDYY